MQQYSDSNGFATADFYQIVSSKCNKSILIVLIIYLFMINIIECFKCVEFDRCVFYERL